MLNKNLVLKVGSLLVIGMMLASAPALVLAKGPESKEDSTNNPSAIFGTGNTGALALPAAGMGSINLINYDGAGRQLTVDFNGIDYVVPPSTWGGSGVWNHVEFSLAPGTYNYTASVTGNDTTLNETITVVAGKVTSIGFYDNPHKSDQDSSRVGHGAEAKPRPALNDLLFSVSDMTAQAH